MQPTVVVTGVGGPAGRAGATFLSSRGYRVVGTDVREVTSPAALLRLVPPAGDPGFQAALLRIVEEEQATLVVPTVTEELPLVARLRGPLRLLGAALSVSGPPGIDDANDKLATARRLGQAGVAVPATLPEGTAPDQVVRTLGLPVLSKPRFGRGGRGVLVHRAASELARAARGDIWQAFLAGQEFDVNLFVERDGQVAAAVVLLKTGLREGLVGNATGVERVHRPDLAGLAAAAAKTLALEGPLDVDVRLGADGSPAVLEVNARLGANVLSAHEVLDALDDAWRNGRCT